jgi:hypothetical protein
MYSQHGAFALVLQNDGNLVVYRTARPNALTVSDMLAANAMYASMTFETFVDAAAPGPDPTNASLKLGEDGSLRIHRADGTVVRELYKGGGKATGTYVLQFGGDTYSSRLELHNGSDSTNPIPWTSEAMNTEPCDVELKVLAERGNDNSLGAGYPEGYSIKDNWNWVSTKC